MNRLKFSILDPFDSASLRSGQVFRFSICLAILMIAIAGTAAGAPSTEAVISKSDGLHIGNTATDRVGFGAATPTARQATTVTAYNALQTLGLIGSGQDYSVQHVTVSLSAAQIIAMYTTPVQIIAAPAAGKSIAVVKAAFTIARTSTAFTGGGVVIFQYGNTANGAGTQALDSTIAATVVTGASGTTVTLRNGAVISDLAAASIQAVGLFISNQTGVFAAGTGTATADVWYIVY
jgi:hypothetical protein